MEVSFGTSTLMRALCVDKVHFQKIINCNGTTSCSYPNTAANTANPNSLATKLDEIAQDVKDAGNSKKEIRSTLLGTDFPTITIG